MNQKYKEFLPEIITSLYRNVKSTVCHYGHKSLISKNSELENLHINERCFIIGSGKSILSQDLEFLSEEIVISLNNQFEVAGFNDWMSNTRVPKYHLCAPIHRPQTELEWKNWFQKMDEQIPENVSMIFGINPTGPSAKKIIDKNEFFNTKNCYYYLTGKSFSLNLRKNINPKKIVFSCESASLYAIFYAIFMNFKEIYLLGMDHDYILYTTESEMRSYKNGIHQKNEFERKFGNSFHTQEWLRQHNIFLKYEYLNNISSCRIYDLSSKGLLRVFPKKELDDIK